MKVRRIILGIVCVCCILNIFFIKKVYAAESVSISISSEKNGVEVGAEVKIFIHVEAEIDISGIEGGLIYDPSILEFKEGAYCENTKEGYVQVNDMGEEKELEKEYEVKFLAKDAGNSVIKFEETPKVCCTEEIIPTVTCEEETIEITQKNNDKYTPEEETESIAKEQDASLAYIKLSSGSLDKEFKADELYYNVVIDNEVKHIDVDAKTSNPNAELYIDNIEELEVGWNKINIIVTAQDSTVKKYVISVYREQVNESEEETNDNVSTKVWESEPEEIVRQNSFALEEKDGEVFLMGDYNYKIVKLEDVSAIPAGYIQSKVVLYGKTIVAYTRKDDEDNNFFLVYAQNINTSEKSFYQYDRIENTMQRYFNDGNIQNSSDDTSKVEEKYKKSLAICAVIIALLLALLILILIFIIRLVMKMQDIKRDVFE